MPIQKKPRGQPESKDENLGLAANGSSGRWEVSVDETTTEPERWFVQIEGPSVCFSFEIASPEGISQALDFLERRPSPKVHARLSAENGSLALGAWQQVPVVLVRDDEYQDRCFFLIGPEAAPVVRFTLAGEDLKQVCEALRQAAEDLEDNE